MEFQNAVIEEARIGNEDHGILTVFLHFKLQDGRTQGLGCYNCSAKNGTNLSVVIEKLFRVFGVGSFDKIKNIPCQVGKSSSGSNIEMIGNILADKNDRSQWFIASEVFK